MDPFTPPTSDNPSAQGHSKKVVQPLPGQTGRDDTTKPGGQVSASPAADLIRQKISALYTDEPNTKEELAEAEASAGHLSKHQRYMQDLSQSGKSLADIQTAWHQYYLNLPDHEKHKVWQEFYAEHAKANRKGRQEDQPEAVQHQAEQPHKPSLPAKAAHIPHTRSDPRSVADIKRQLVSKVRKRERTKRSPHVQSLLFGLGTGGVVVVLLLLSFFNERIIAPFITPSRTVSSTPIIVDPSSTVVGPEPKIIIPKINVEIPVVYDEPSIEENAVQTALERGVLHYATTPNPGELGNAVIFGHSSNNILNRGKYKFAFVLLSRLENGDTFMLQKGGKRYVYKVFKKEIVPPTDLTVLGKTNKPATVTLITCDPPGTSINRLVVVGEQISPHPGGNIASSVKQNTDTKPVELPSNAPSLWQRLTDWLTG